MANGAEKYSAIIIGAGQAGPGLANRLTGAGRTVAFVERSHFGGTCVNTGCTPTKTMIASARAAHVVRTAGRLGVDAGPVTIDLAAIRKRKDEVLLASRNGVRNWLKGMDNCTVIEEHARFEAPRLVRAGDRLLEADQIFIDVGGHPFTPDWSGLGEVDWFNNETIMELDEVPRHLVVVGGSYVGLEFAQMFRRFGAEVTVTERSPRLVPKEDEDVSDAVKSMLEAEGIKIDLGTECIGCGKADGGELKITSDAGNEIRGTHLLLAMGRRPNTHDLGLERAGIATDERGYIAVDDSLETSVAGVYALGDVNGRGAFTHTAYDDHLIAADQILGDGRRSVRDRIRAYALFTDPPLGRVGISETEARQSDRNIRIARLPMARVSRARERDETTGFMKAIVDADTDRILGATIFGIEGDEVIQTILAMMYADRPWTSFGNVMIHPTVTELLPTLMARLEPA